MHTKVNVDIQVERERKPYMTPSLEVLGNVSDLVMAGGSTANENVNGAMRTTGGM